MSSSARSWLLAGGLLLAACTPAPVPIPQPSPSHSAPPSSAMSQRVGQRDCASRVHVGFDDAAWRAAPSAGPAAFAPLDYTWGDPGVFAARTPDEQGWRRFKVAMRLQSGTPATLTIPAVHRDVAALTYLNGLDHTIAFSACGETSDPVNSEFAGGFALREAVCLPLELNWNGGTDRVVLDFGKGRC